MVRCVLISEDPGNISEIETRLDSDLYQILKGPGTFIGQIGDIVIMKCEKSQFDLMENRNVIPGVTEVIHGPILLVKMDENAEPQNLSIDEWVSLSGLGMNQTF
jgi:hypothetical protein